MPVVDADRTADLPQLQAEPGTLSGPIIGIIYPPPEVRSILNLKKYVLQTFSWFLAKANILYQINE